MSEIRFNKDQNPSGVWQAIWAELFKIVNEHLINGTSNNFRMAWRSLLLLQSEIPPECQTDTKESFTKAKQVMDFQTYNKDKQLEIDAPIALREVLAAVITSLYTRHWINKPEFGAQPKYEKKGHL